MKGCVSGDGLFGADVRDTDAGGIGVGSVDDADSEPGICNCAMRSAASRRPHRRPLGQPVPQQILVVLCCVVSWGFFLSNNCVFRSLFPDLTHYTVRVTAKEFATILFGISILKQLIHQSGEDLIGSRCWESFFARYACLMDKVDAQLVLCHRFIDQAETGVDSRPVRCDLQTWGIPKQAHGKNCTMRLRPYARRYG